MKQVAIKYGLAVEVNKLSLKSGLFAGYMTLDKIVILIVLVRKIGIMIPGALVSCKDNGEQGHKITHHLSVFRTLRNQHSPGFSEPEILMQCALHGTVMRFFFCLFCCLFLFEEKDTTDSVLMDY